MNEYNEYYDSDGKRTSHLLLGLFLNKYSREVEYINRKEPKGPRQLSATQFSILDLLHDRDGGVFLADLKNLCWPSPSELIADETIRSTISGLNKRLNKAGIPEKDGNDKPRRVVRVVKEKETEEELIIFDASWLKSLPEFQQDSSKVLGTADWKPVALQVGSLRSLLFRNALYCSLGHAKKFKNLNWPRIVIQV